jgi:hypothetical protein
MLDLYNSPIILLKKAGNGKVGLDPKYFMIFIMRKSMR